MANRKTKQNYNMTTGGSIKVGKSGIYIIHANVNMKFTHITPLKVKKLFAQTTQGYKL